jgi:hypothetical protein
VIRASNPGVGAAATPEGETEMVRAWCATTLERIALDPILSTLGAVSNRR